ncbi:MAG: 50S ribosomal protein L25 [Patescibacteria group bacterium]
MELTAQLRDQLNKGGNRTSREAGLVPAELYGHGLKNQHISVNAKEFTKAFKEAGESTVLQLVIDKKKHAVMIHDIQKNPLTQAVRHIDFYEVRMDEKTTVNIPLIFMGEAPAVKEKKGTLNKALSELEVEALPSDLPHTIEVPLASLIEVGMSIHVKDLALSTKVKALIDAEAVVVTIVPLTEEEVVVAPVTVADVQVESELKKAEREKEKASKEA